MRAMCTSESGIYETPSYLFSQLNARFRFTLDVCATPENAKCSRFYTTADDGLAQPWTGVCWCNPPFGRQIPLWLAKANEAAKAGATVVCLVPVRTDSSWWHAHVVMHEVEFLPRRLRFVGRKHQAPFACAVVVMRPPARVLLAAE
jgi:phage N-6-adenine-methyltransferase